MQDFRRLRVWRKAFALAINTRRATQRFPRTGYAELKAQMISAAESIFNNIVEGCGASSQKEFARFLDTSIKSSMELEGEFQLAYGYGAVPKADWLARQTEIIETRQMLYGLRQKVLADDLSKSISDSRRTAQNSKPTAHQDAERRDGAMPPPPPPQTPQTTSSPPPDYPSTPPDATALPPRTLH
ncbi:MAG: four helix bundle protein [Gemmatimonadetes bacterium]|nr:four helix bundle protein [Gemmatimonadota bacterium]